MVLEEITFTDELKDKINGFIFPYIEYINNFDKHNPDIWDYSTVYNETFKVEVRRICAIKKSVFNLMNNINNQSDFLELIHKYRLYEKTNNELFKELTDVFYRIDLFKI